MGTFEQTFKDHRYNLPDAVRKSRTWFQQQALLLNKERIIPSQLIRSAPSLNRKKIIPGELYLFQYDAKHQDTLPYWDMFPLVFPFSETPDGFIGLNMHYLPYQMRFQLLDRLMVFRTSQTLNETTRLKYSWQTIAGLSKFKIAEACVKRYLLNHVQSPFKKIEADNWGTAMMLPVERFVGASKQVVWNESIK